MCCVSLPLEIWTKCCPPRPYLYLVITWESHHLPGPITPQEPRLASAQLTLPRPLLDCPATPCLPPQPGFSSPGIRAFKFSALPSPLLLHLHRSPDRRAIPSTLTPGHPVHASPTNRTVPQLGSLPSHVGNGHPFRSQISSQSSSLASLLPITPPSSSTSSQRPCPRQLPPPNKARFVAHPPISSTSPHFS